MVLPFARLPRVRPPSPLAVRTITPAQHLDYVHGLREASFLQTPAWAAVKAEWGHESLGWYDGERLVGAGLVLYRQLPRLRRYLAYLPEGPLIDWSAGRLGDWLDPMADHLRRAGAFGVRIGPPVVVRRWSATEVKAGLADSAVRRLTDLTPTGHDPVGARVAAHLAASGWRTQGSGSGFAAGQPAHLFWLPLAGRSEADVLAGMNQLWRRNIKKADKAGVEVARSSGVGAEAGDLRAFHDLYVHTARRDGFTPRGRAYFEVMAAALGAEDNHRFRLYLARHESDLVAATILVRVGVHAWYSYGASSTEKREVRGSNAVQWAMIRDSLASGAAVYDLRGITPTLDGDDPHVGLIQFKVGTGGEAVEVAGEWDLPLDGPGNRALYAAFELYLRRRA